MQDDLTFGCKCGAVRARLAGGAPGTGCHLVCYCADCRAAARHLNATDGLEPGGGSPLYQTLPSRVTITEGHDRIGCFRLSPRGLHRWFAACCNTPIGNTVGTPKVPLVGLWRGTFVDPGALGPVRARVFTKYAQPGGPTKDIGVAVMSWGFVRRSIMAYVSGQVRPHPFFTDDGRPIVAPTVLSRSDRARLGE